MKRLGLELSVPNGLISGGTFLKKHNGGGLMNEHPFRAIRLGRTGLAAAVLIPCIVIAICCTLPAFAAERTVLCEEFTNKW